MEDLLSHVRSIPEQNQNQNRTSPTNEELNNVTLALQKLWDLDENRVNPGVDYALNLSLASRAPGGNTPDKLFQFVSSKVGQIPTYKTFYNLLDNYIPDTGIPEKVTKQELTENQAFIKACLQTSPMMYAFNYLKAKNIFKGSLADFEKELHVIWFQLYKREAYHDSSAFEHVFVGEVRDGEAKAFHNWIMLYFYEKAGKIDYEGFIPGRGKKNDEPDPNSHVISIRFTFKGAKKPFSTSFVGTSPEFELAMYTLLFMIGREDTKATFDHTHLNLKVYPFHEKGGDGKRLLGSAFPMILDN